MHAVDVACALVNSLATTRARGRSLPRPDEPDEVRAQAEEALRDAGAHRSVVHRRDVDGLRRLAGQLRDVFDALDADDQDSAADTLNALLAESDARPRLHRHPPEPWHLHFHPPGAGVVDGWTAVCATALATVLGTDRLARLGTCAAENCDQVYVDTSRNGTRRFCGLVCQNRAKAAAHRSRTAR
ncbi:MAG: CGNR zinc finger domain-containing protein [Phycicoccus sp.]